MDEEMDSNQPIHDISEEENHSDDEKKEDEKMDFDHISTTQSPKMISPSNDEDTRQDDDEEASEQESSPNYVEYTGAGEDGTESLQGTPKEDDTGAATTGATTSSARPPKLVCPVDSTLWMSDLLENWDNDFLSKAFEKFGYKPKNIKIISDKAKGRPYAFVEFDTADIAKKAILKANGRSIPGDTEKHKFRLSFANLPNQIIYEYCLAVSNLSSAVDDAALFKLFGSKYPSCRGAKVHVNPDGTTKRSGIVKFSNQTDQQLALVEMNKYVFKGRELILRLGATKQRGPKNLLAAAALPHMYPQMGIPPPVSFGMYPSPGQAGAYGQPVYNPYVSTTTGSSYRSRDRKSPDRYDRRRSRSRERSTRDRHGRGRDRSPSSRRRRSRSRDRKRKAKDLDDYVANQRSKELFLPTYFPQYIQDNKPWTVEEYNNAFIDSSEEGFAAIESSKWSDFVIPSDWTREDIIKQLYPEALVDA